MMSGSPTIRSLLFAFFPAGIILLLISGCSLINKIAGADIDPEQFSKAREAKIYEIRAEEAKKLMKRLIEKGPITEADFVFLLSENLLNHIALQYTGIDGRLDESISYNVKGVSIELFNGCAIASLDLLAHHSSYGVDVNLKMDCLMAFKTDKNELIAKIEPFNIVPDVDAPGVISFSEDLIANLIKINLGDIGKKFPGLKIPLDFGNSIEISEKTIEVRDKINLDAIIPEKKINYSLQLKEALILRGKILVSFNIGEINVR